MPVLDTLGNVAQVQLNMGNQNDKYDQDGAPLAPVAPNALPPTPNGAKLSLADKLEETRTERIIEKRWELVEEAKSDEDV